MSKLRSQTSIELEIQALLLHHGSADFAADAIIKKYENENLTVSEFETLANFLLVCGFYSSLISLFQKKLKSNAKLSWAYFCEALKRARAPVSPEQKKLILAVATEQDAISELSRSVYLDDIAPELESEKKMRRKAFVDKYFKIRNDSFQEMNLMRSQGLNEQEEQILEKLSRLFPGDSEISERRQSLRQLLAVDIIASKQKELSKIKTSLFIPYHEPLDAETAKILEQIFQNMNGTVTNQENNQFLAEDFAVALMTWENEDAALKILEQAPATISSDWLKAEILLSARRFVELLHHLTWLEATYGEDPECLFSVNYLRAQALWGLNQKSKAIDILQGLITTRPQYRAAHSLLNQWQESLHE